MCWQNVPNTLQTLIEQEEDRRFKIKVLKILTCIFLIAAPLLALASAITDGINLKSSLFTLAWSVICLVPGYYAAESLNKVRNGKSLEDWKFIPYYFLTSFAIIIPVTILVIIDPSRNHFSSSLPAFILIRIFDYYILANLVLTVFAAGSISEKLKQDTTYLEQIKTSPSLRCFFFFYNLFFELKSELNSINIIIR